MLEPPYYFRKLSSNAPLKKKKKEWAGLYFFIAVCALHFAAFITFSTTLKKVEPVKKRIAVQTMQLASKEPASSLMQKSPAILPKENLIATASTAIEPPQKVVSAPVEKKTEQAKPVEKAAEPAVKPPLPQKPLPAKELPTKEKKLVKPTSAPIKKKPDPPKTPPKKTPIMKKNEGQDKKIKAEKEKARKEKEEKARKAAQKEQERIAQENKERAEKKRQEALLKEKLASAQNQLAQSQKNRHTQLSSTPNSFAQIKQLKGLQVDTLAEEISELTNWSSKEISYYDEVAALIKASLCLPDYGSVKLELTITKEGKVAEVKILASQSQKNRDYIDKTIVKLKFAPFGAHFSGKERVSFPITLKT